MSFQGRNNAPCIYILLRHYGYSSEIDQHLIINVHTWSEIARKLPHLWNGITLLIYYRVHWSSKHSHSYKGLNMLVEVAIHWFVPQTVTFLPFSPVYSFPNHMGKFCSFSPSTRRVHMLILTEVNMFYKLRTRTEICLSSLWVPGLLPYLPHYLTIKLWKPVCVVYYSIIGRDGWRSFPENTDLRWNESHINTTHLVSSSSYSVVYCSVFNILLSS